MALIRPRRPQTEFFFLYEKRKKEIRQKSCERESGEGRVTETEERKNKADFFVLNDDNKNETGVRTYA